MRSMAPASTSLPGFVMALAALATSFVAPAALAQTAPLPAGYTGDVTTAPRPYAGADPTPAALPPLPEQVAPGPVPLPVDGADAVSPDEFADADPSALTDFREPLAPYGQWTQDPTYGTIWVPDAAQVGADFAPYQTAGNWATTDDGDWMWQSDYAWGAIPFHYGRWVWASNNWGWIPGRRYAPAWVSFRVGQAGYLGWAPTPPSWYWAGRHAVGLSVRPYAAYCFVPTTMAFMPGVSRYVVQDRGMVASIAASTRPYHAATPTGGSRGASISRVGRSYPASPRLSEAHIPASASPRSHAAPDAQAVAFATRGGTAAMRSSRGRASYGSYGGPSSADQGWSRYSHPERSQAPSLRTPPSRGYTSYRSAYPSLGASSSLGQRYGRPAGVIHAPVATPARSRSAPQGAAPHVSAGHSSGGRRR